MYIYICTRKFNTCSYAHKQKKCCYIYKSLLWTFRPCELLKQNKKYSRTLGYIYIYIHTHKKLKKNTRGPEGHIFLYTPYKYTPKKNGGPEGEKLYFLSIYTLQIAETDYWIRVVIVFMTNRITITTHNVHYSYYSGGPAGKNCWNWQLDSCRHFHDRGIFPYIYVYSPPPPCRPPPSPSCPLPPHSLTLTTGCVSPFSWQEYFWGEGWVFEKGGILIREYMWVIQKYLYGNTGIYVGHTEIYTHFFLFFSGLGN